MAAEKEICMTDILNAMGEMRFVETCALRFDTGSKEGLFDAFKYVMKNIAFYAD
jgi:UTP-glucose-1-phosphate uridylyltransferase